MVTKEQLPSGREVLALPREVKAAIDMTVALAAREFVGNSVSTFSAFIFFLGPAFWAFSAGSVSPVPWSAGELRSPAAAASKS